MEMPKLRILSGVSCLFLSLDDFGESSSSLGSGNAQNAYLECGYGRNMILTVSY